jgi:hypothetical protein
VAEVFEGAVVVVVGWGGGVVGGAVVGGGGAGVVGGAGRVTGGAVVVVEPPRTVWAPAGVVAVPIAPVTAVRRTAAAASEHAVVRRTPRVAGGWTINLEGFDNERIEPSAPGNPARTLPDGVERD